MGADVMRWMFCEANPSQNIKFGYGPANDVKRRLLTLWNSVGFLLTYANIEGFRPRYQDLEGGPQGIELRPRSTAGSSRGRSRFSARLEGAYERYWTPDVTGAFERFVDDVSNWYIRRSRRFYSLDEAAFRTLWYALVQAVRGIAPVMPFLAEHLWQNLVAGPCEDAPRSVHLAGWPEPRGSRTTRWSPRWGGCGASSSSATGRARPRGSSCASPCAGSSSRARRSPRGMSTRSRRELRVKEVEFGEVEATELTVKPNLPVLGPKLGKGSAPFGPRSRPASSRSSPAAASGLRGTSSARRGARRAARPRGLGGRLRGRRHAVALDTALDDELRTEGRVLDLIHQLNSMRKDRARAHRSHRGHAPGRARRPAGMPTGSRTRSSPRRSAPTAAPASRRS